MRVWAATGIDLLVENSVGLGKGKGDLGFLGILILLTSDLLISVMMLAVFVSQSQLISSVFAFGSTSGPTSSRGVISPWSLGFLMFRHQNKFLHTTVMQSMSCLDLYSINIVSHRCV